MISSLPGLLFSARPSCISVVCLLPFQSEICAERGPSLPFPSCSCILPASWDCEGCLSSPSLVFSFPDLLVKFLVGSLMFHSPQPQLQHHARELCDFSICFLPNLFIFLATLLGMNFCPLPQIRSVLSGSKAAGFHSQPHPGRTMYQLSCVKGDV